MYNEKIYLDWIKERYISWYEVVTMLYHFNLKRSFVFFTENEYRQNEYIEYSKKYFKKEIKWKRKKESCR